MKELPQDINAELSCLATLLLSDSVFDKVNMMINSEDFYLSQHRIIYAAITNLINSGKPADTTNLRTELKRTNDFIKVGGDKYLAHLYMNSALSVNAVSYAKTIREMSNRRKLIKVAHETLENSYDLQIDLEETIGETENDLIEITKRNKDEQFKSIADLAKIGVREIFKQMKHVKTGIAALDARTHGFTGGQLITLAARPGCGKSSFALQIADSTKAKCIFYSLEMKNCDNLARILSSRTGFSYTEITNDKITDYEYEIVEKQQEKLKQSELRIVDTLRSFNDIYTDIKANYIKNNLEIVIIDYLQIIAMKSKEPTHEKLSKITGGLKQLAMQLNIPIILLSQLNRETESTQGRPMLSHLKGSGSIEQDSDCIIFLHSDDKSSDVPETEIIIAKGRNYGIGIINSVFEKKRFRFIPKG